MLPTQEEVEEYASAVTDYVYGLSESVYGHGQDLYWRLRRDIQRHGPSWPNVSVPGLGSFEIPAPPPRLDPPPIPLPWYRLGFIEDEEVRRPVLIAGVATLGLGMATWAYIRTRDARIRRKDVTDKSKLRREVVVVLGGDTLAGPSLIHALERKGFVVIASVSIPDAVDHLEKKSKGNVKALVLNPKEPASVQYFLRSLNAALSLRYPLNLPGDPYLPSGSSSMPTTNVLISCISLLSINPTPTPIPLERLNLSSEYLPTLYETHLTPLAAIQGILPLFRIATSRQGVGHANSKHANVRTSVIVLVPAVASRVGVAFDGARAMAIAGMVRGVEVMRREIGSETSVILVDVGAIASPGEEVKGSEAEVDVVGITKAWSASERRAYGPAYESALIHSSANPSSQPPTSRRRKHHQPQRRTPTDVDSLVTAILPLVYFTRSSRSRWHPLYVFTHLAKTWHRVSLYLQGYRISVGAGATTYTIASLLPHWILDAILDLPANMTSWRDKIMPPPPSVATTTEEKQTSTRVQRGPKSAKMIEAEERAISTAPASTESGGSRRESIGSFEGVSVGVESGDESHRAARREGTAGTIIAPDSQGVEPVVQEEHVPDDDSLGAKSPSEGHVRTPSLGSGHLPGHQPTSSGTSEQGSRITDSWVSLGAPSKGIL